MITVTFDETKWQLVPKVPDTSQQVRGESILKDEFGYAQRNLYVRQIYNAMLAAAPSASLNAMEGGE